MKNKCPLLLSSLVSDQGVEKRLNLTAIADKSITNGASFYMKKKGLIIFCEWHSTFLVWLAPLVITMIFLRQRVISERNIELFV